ncbi:MurR/RpiR family transcriptional regulator [Fonticella tunisiensis]|uniref:RpiR family transcriptional regulator n=1 Tax=Fonticella tunisiensis TaxID=1096341 RepID=A0A4R7KU34_9CLOT|nr:MurR/RpiR family transcriptional regulator [Fonticella tunisiensis]TDT62851.1 RpiR family transcriptional regulator [Fonticella tunisiensis]
MKFEERVRIFEHKLNDTDDQIIDYIRSNKEEVINISIQKLAQKLFTVPNTIIRLSRKLGYEGFSELKLALKSENDIRPMKLSDISENIRKSYEFVDMEVIDKIARKFEESKKVLFYGVGDSIYFCEMMAKNLRCVGKKAEFFVHRHDMIYSAENINPKDLVFVISASGETKQVLEPTVIAKEKGAFIISLTHLSDNSLAKLAAINLYCWAPKQKLNNYDITDRTSMMIVLRKLSEHYWKHYC